MRIEHLRGKDRYDYEADYQLHTFDSLTEFCDAIKHENGNSGSFFDHVSLAQAKQLAITGWPDGLKKLEQFSAKLGNVAARSIAKQEVIFDVTGIDFDMGAVMSGEPECWYDLTPRDETKTVRMAYNVIVSGGMSQEMMQLRGACIAALVDLLEANNIRVELDAYGTLDYMYQHKISMIIQIKSASQHLDLDRLAFVFMHAGMSRKLTFSYCQTVCNNQSDSSIGWGITPDLSNYDLNISGGHIGLPEYASIQEMIEWLKARLADFGVHMKSESGD